MTDGKIYAIDELRALISPIAAQYGVDRIFLFGSYARGQATENSDVDLRIDKGNVKGLFTLGALYSDLEERLGKKLDLLTTGSLDQQFLSHIAQEEVLLYDHIAVPLHTAFVNVAGALHRDELPVRQLRDVLHHRGHGKMYHI